MQYVRNAWYVAGWDSELAPGDLLAVTIAEELLLIYRTADGELVGLEDRCCHRSAPLSKGRIEDGCNIRCMYHGFKFDPAGRCIAIPGQSAIPSAAKVRAFPVAASMGWIWIWMGDEGAADVSLLPAKSGLDQPLLSRRGFMDYRANYELINDNLTDFSHLSFVHHESFGNTEVWAEFRPNVRPLDRGVQVSRQFTPDQPPFKPTALGARRHVNPEPKRMVQTYDYVVPGILLMESRFYREADMAADNTPREGAEPLTVRIDLQAVTPIGERDSRYYFQAHIRPQDGGETMADQLLGDTLRAFAEDREMIEAQQVRLDLRNSPQVLGGSDVAPVQMRAAVRKLISREQQDARDESAKVA
jgi:phenylpropionate dioxygenase-like ring-hydroxylating dioxygenase large terminal subunit